MEIRARKLSASYPAAGRSGLALGRRTVVREVSFAVAPGEVVALAGKNGSGKSTTLRLLAGLLPADRGDALLGEVPATRSEARRHLGYLAEEDEFPAGLSVRDTLRYAAVLAGYRGAGARREAERTAETVGVAEWLAIPAGRASRGVRRRVSLAQALLGEPRALVLDEPLTGLDPEARVSSLAAIRSAAREGAAVILSLHEAAAIESVADRLIVLADGAVAAAGPVEDFVAKGGKHRSDRSAAERSGGWLAAALNGASLPIR